MTPTDSLTLRRLPRRAALLALCAAALLGGCSLFRFTPAAAPPAPDPYPPIIFVHGNGDHAALWITTLWRFESNGYPGDRLGAINFTDPLARADDAVAQPDRSSTADQLRELNAAIDGALTRTGATRVALVGSSRGGYAIRNLIASGGAARVSHAVLCGVPNRGV
jgi:pimeloyl-ACP methyl ester carboxylesterase